MPYLLSALLILIPAASEPVNERCQTGYITEHRSIEGVAKLLDREDASVDAYIGIRDLPQLGRYYLLFTQGNEPLYVRAVDIINRNHYDDHVKLWGDSWLADLQSDAWKKLGKPVTGTLCRIKKRNTNYETYTHRRIRE